MILSGPAPSRADWPLTRWPCLINKFSGERLRTRSRRVSPGTRPARRRDPGPAPRSWPLGEPREARAGGSAGARVPGARRSRPRSQPARNPCSRAGQSCGWSGGPALHGPSCCYDFFATRCQSGGLRLRQACRGRRWSSPQRCCGHGEHHGHR